MRYVNAFNVETRTDHTSGGPPMPRGNWRWVVAVGIACGGGGGLGAAPPASPVAIPLAPAGPTPRAPVAPTPPPAALPALAPPAPPAATGPALPAAAAPTPVPPGSTLEYPIKDLTPPGFATDAHGAGGHEGGHGAGHGGVPGHLKPAAPDEGGPFGSAEFLLLRPRRGAFDFAIPSSGGGLATDGPARSLNYELRTGLRAELGYRLHSGWDVLAGYTYFRSNAFDAGSAPPGQVILPTRTRPGLTDTVSFAGADANLEYNIYDAAVGRRFAVDEHLALRLYGGLRFASIRQDFKAYYDGLDARAATVASASNFTGFGPVVGGEAVFAGWRGFHLYARASGGLLTGTADNPLTETNNAGRTVYVRSGYDVRKVVPMASAGVGAGWQYRTVSIRAGYEITHFIDLIDQPRFVDDVGRGKFVAQSANLSLEGLFLRFGLAF